MYVQVTLAPTAMCRRANSSPESKALTNISVPAWPVSIYLLESTASRDYIFEFLAVSIILLCLSTEVLKVNT